jgi:hypothetical protein
MLEIIVAASLLLHDCVYLRDISSNFKLTKKVISFDFIFELQFSIFDLTNHQFILLFCKLSLAEPRSLSAFIVGRI